MMWWDLVSISCLSEVAPGDIKSELPSVASGAADKAGQKVQDVVACGGLTTVFFLSFFGGLPPRQPH